MSWSRRHTLLAGSAALATSGLGWALRRPAPTGPSPVAPSPPVAPVRPPLPATAEWSPHRHAGVNLAHIHARGRGYGSDACRRQLDALARHGVRQVALTPFAYLPTLDGVDLRWRALDATLTEQDLLDCAADLHARGMQPVLKPHIWCGAFGRGGASRQDIRPAEHHGGWARWFEVYTEFVTAQARLAARMDAALLVVGLEYLQATLEAPGAWADVARACRAEFAGPLTYAANWWREAESFADWSAFDLIGLNAYHPLDVAPDADAAALAAAWAPHLARLGGLSTQAGRSVLFCEAGVPSVVGAAREPWNASFSGPEDPTLPATYAEALLRAAAPQPWFAGVYWWKWFSDHVDDERHGHPDPYGIAGRPIADTLRRWWAPAAPVSP